MGRVRRLVAGVMICVAGVVFARRSRDRTWGVRSTRCCPGACQTSNAGAAPCPSGRRAPRRRMPIQRPPPCDSCSGSVQGLSMAHATLSLRRRVIACFPVVMVGSSLCTAVGAAPGKPDFSVQRPRPFLALCQVHAQVFHKAVLRRAKRVDKQKIFVRKASGFRSLCFVEKKCPGMALIRGPSAE